MLGVTLTSCNNRIEQLESDLEDCLSVQEELNERISELEEQVDELETENSYLQNELDDCKNEVSDLEFNELFRN